MPTTPVRLTKKYVPERHKKAAKIPDDAHEWVSFEDPKEERIWMFDVTFLLSGWNCIFGRGCQGVLTGPTPQLSQGCCSYGAHFSDAEDQKRIVEYAKRLKPNQWQFYNEGQKGIWKKLADGSTQTRLVKDACIFLNRPEFEKGAGCALHVAALESGESYIDWKPEVCWQLPLHRDDQTRDDGWVISTISQWERGHWGDGGYDFAWWCTEAEEAFGARQPVYKSMREELLVLVGHDAYTMLATYLDKRQKPTKPLVHPVEK
jgi:hypothetical protein